MRRKKHLFHLILILAAVLAAVAVRPAAAAGPPEQPMLRVETEMHTAMINRIGVDDSGRYLVTASDDKTARVWDLTSGRLIQVLRPPIGEGPEGKIYCGTISPDGNLVAAGGWTGYEWEQSNSVYLFDRQTGRLVHRITDLPNVILNVTFSKDGMFLAVSLGGKNGIRVYQAPRFNLVAEDKNYDGQSYGTDFSPDGRLAASCYDGYIRLYDRNFRLIAKKGLPEAGEPVGVRFSPDGTKIAVGYNNIARVAVFSAQNLDLLYQANTQGMDNEGLEHVAWSWNGQVLLAGGEYDEGDYNPIITWSDQGRGVRNSLKVAQDTIMDMLPLADGTIVFGSADPAWGLIDLSGRMLLGQTPTIANFRGNREGFLVSLDGTEVKFGYELWGEDPASFSINQRELNLSGNFGRNLTQALVEGPNMDVKGWKDGAQPTVNGNALELENYERARCVAVNPDGSGLALGADWNLRYFNREGKLIWNTAPPAVVWSVNIPQNGNVVVGAFGDGTIRWYRISDGQELLAFFPHNDRRRWVLWTPSGYYDAAPGGEDLIGWHLNRAPDQESDFFTASRFRAAYYRPDVIARVLETLDEAGAVRLADSESNRRSGTREVEEMLPPVIRIIYPPDGSSVSDTQVKVKYLLRSPSGEPVTGIKVLIDGRPVSQGRGIGIQTKPGSRQAQEFEVTLEIPPHDVELGLIAENKYASSEPSLIRLKYNGAAGPAEDENKILKPQLWVLAIGVSDYENNELDLGFASKDAQDFAQVVTAQEQKLYDKVNVKLLVDAKATKGNILDGLEWIEKSVTAKDVAMIFIAGHGVNDQVGDYYFLPANSDLGRLRRTGLPFTEIQKTVATLAGKTLFFVDTCHAGNVMGARRGATDINAVVNELSSAENGAVVFASSTGRQYSLENKSWGNGAFTKALVEALAGKADFTGQGKITINMIDLYLSERVKELTEGRQTPTTTKPQTIQDFPVAVTQ